MTINTSLSALIYSTGGTLFALVGAFCLVVGLRSRRGRLVGAFALIFGLRPALQNLFFLDALQPWYDALNLLGAALAVALAIDLARGIGPRAWRLLLACAAVLSIATVAVAVGHARGFRGSAPRLSGVITAVSIVWLVAACGVRFASLPLAAGKERRATACAAIAFGLHSFVFLTPSLGPDGDSWQSIGYAFGAAVAIVILVWLKATTGADPRVARNVVFTLLVAGVLGLIESPIRVAMGVENLGGSGIARIIGSAVLVVAVTRYDLLDAPLPRLAAAKGPLAVGALATLFIVAQLAQNFLAAQYGLLLGGIVAGAFVFAAMPIQRAIENRAAGGQVPRSADVGKEDAYRNALRIALRDRVLTEDEEVHLAHLSDELGLTHRRAREIRNDVQREEEAE